ncbi:vacuolar protein sorting-associated protein 8 homolog [Tigriopus californicus]|uniref:vacuolar protein sorting-associated protein 8 homolog n=1 Tax=Tigriopus californicus TaxID=6832 RepID=UPI0027DA4786|nr:vacuolar protein sorting-associated protein 8 homolog [Tigriopus californicus]XP_059091838.1 vacuolar protein sorting-associated protein 8 homolog [Tigriopus californicus]
METTTSLEALEAFEPLEDLDDEEFGLPAVGQLPSLADILGENPEVRDEDYEDEEEALNGGLEAVDYGTPSHNGVWAVHNSSLLDSLSIMSRGSRNSDQSRSRTSNSSKMSRRQPPEKEKHGSIMRHVILKGITSQMVSLADRVNVGIPTCMASTLYIAIGTSHGFILVFDSLQVLKWSLGGAKYGQDYGSVSAIDFNIDSSRLLVGFAKGQLLEYDINAGKLTMVLNDAHPVSSPVIHAKYTDDPNLALVSDAAGSIFEIQFKRPVGLRKFSSRCIFSGSRGEVVAVEPLSLVQYPEHRMRNQIVVGVATISKVIVLALKPSLKVLFSCPLPGRTDTLPIISWQFVIIVTSDNQRVVDPVVAFGRQSTIHFYQLSENLGGKTVFIPLRTLELTYEFLHFGWLNTKCMAIMDTSEGFHLEDVRNSDELESFDLADVRLIYGSSFFKGLATGENVSRAMSVAGDRAIYGSFKTYTNQLLLLGRKSFHVLVIRTWNERLEHLVKNNRYIEALDLGCEFYQDTSKTLVGLKGPKDKKKTVIAQKVLSIVLKYLDVCMTKNFPQEGNIGVLSDYFHDIVPPFVNTCMTLRRKDILFENVWNTFLLDPFAKAKFLEGLEVYILSDQLKDLPVNVCQEFVSHYEIVKKYQELEACITHLHVSSLDIHQVMNVCWTHGLYDAIIYIYNNGMLDYITPTEELMSQLRNIMSSLDNHGLSLKQTELGNKILVYISCCLAGRAYPYGDIPSDRLAQVKYDVYTCLTCLHSKKATDNEPSYPFLKTLLHFDTQGLLNVISIAFEEPEFNTEMGRCQKQRMVDILLQIMVDGDEGYSPAQIGHLFTFLARQVAKDGKTLSVSRDLFDKVLDVLTNQVETSHHEERQQALFELLDAGGLQYFDRNRLIEQCQRVKFNRILEMLYESSQEYDLVLECYIHDEYRSIQAFAFIQRVLLSDDHYGDEAKGKVEKDVIQNLEALIAIDPKKLAMVVYFHMYSYIPVVISRLESQRECLFRFLKFALEHKENGSQPASPVHKANHASYVDPLTTKTTLMMFLELMCEFEPKMVASYLKTRSNYDHTAVLKVCEKYDILDAMAHVLEQDGQIEEAFALLMKPLDSRLQEISNEDSPGEDLIWAQVNASVILLVQLCQRSASHLPGAKVEQLWFSILDSLLSRQRTIQNGKKIQGFKEVIKHVVNSTIGHLPLRSVIGKILQDPAYQSGSFGEIKGFLLEMLEMYHYEETLLKSTVELVQADVHTQVRQRHRAAQRGFFNQSLRCHLCRQHLARQGGNALIFQCRHAYHIPCLAGAGCVSVSKVGEEDWHCYSCITKNNSHQISVGETSESSTKVSAVPEPLFQLDESELSNITDQKLVKARQYLEQMKAMQSPLATHEWLGDSELSSREYIEENKSIFDRENFKLRLQPPIPEDI